MKSTFRISSLLLLGTVLVSIISVVSADEGSAAINGFEIGSYKIKSDDQSMADVSRKLYGNARYADALTQFNRTLPIVRSDTNGHETPVWRPGLTIYFPPLSVLIRKYANEKIPKHLLKEDLKLPRVTDKATGWSKYGYLRKTPFRLDGEPVYVLEGPKSKPLLYVKARLGFTLSVYAGQNMTVYGAFQYAKTADLEGYCMTAERVWEKAPRAVKSPTRKYMLPAEFSPEARGKIKELRLLFSRDKGKTWKVFEATSQQKRAFYFQAPEDGLYWLMLQVVYKDGTIDPKDPKKSPPHQIIEVDTSEKQLKQIEDQVEMVQQIVDFVGRYQQNPNLNRVPEILALMFKENLFDNPALANENVVRATITHALGHMARGQPKLVRLFESYFTKANTVGRDCLLESLLVCGDEQTIVRMREWQKDAANLNLAYSLSAAGKALTNLKHLPRHRQALTEYDLESLWADFLVTGEYAPVSRILDILDRPGVFRKKIEALLQKDANNRKDLVEALQAWDLLKPGTETLIETNLELALLHNSRGRLKEGAFVAAVTLAQKFLGLSIEEVNRGVRLQGNASLEMQNILENYPKLVELLQKHCRERPAPSQDLIKKWLRIDQPRSKPNKRARPLQGTWQAVAWKEDDEQYNLKLKKEVLKLVTLTFDVEELRATEALPMILARQKVTSKGSTIFGTYNMESKNTRALTLVLPNPNRGFTVPSIYQVEGDVLRICISKKGGLPDDFSVPSGSERILITFKKVK